MSYANLIQAFSRTNRTYPDKTKGLIVTFRKPALMEKNVQDATRLYSNDNDDSSLVYPTYEESKKRFNKAHKALNALTTRPDDIDEHSPIDERIDFVKAYQELNNAFGALITYDDYNDDMEKANALPDKVKTLEEYTAIYNTVKGSLVAEDPSDYGDEAEIPDYSDLEFYGEHSAILYDIDSRYIDKLLGDYSANNEDIRSEIEKALQKLNKSEVVKDVYRSILNAIDMGEIQEENIFTVKRSYFTRSYETAISDFAKTWFVEEHELHASAVQYHIGADPIPNIGGIISNNDFASYKEANPGAMKLKYGPELKRQWRTLLDEVVIPLGQELK